MRYVCVQIHKQVYSIKIQVYSIKIYMYLPIDPFVPPLGSLGFSQPQQDVRTVCGVGFWGREGVLVAKCVESRVEKHLEQPCVRRGP